MLAHRVKNYLRVLSGFATKREEALAIICALIAATGVRTISHYVLGRRRFYWILTLLLATVSVVSTALLSYWRSVKAMTRAERRETAAERGLNEPIDLRYRNPSWAAAQGGAVRLPENCEFAAYNTDGCIDALPIRETRQTASDTPVDVWFLPSARYHVQEFGPIIRSLETMDARCAVVVDTRTTEGIRAECAHWGLSQLDISSVWDTIPVAVVVMNDWGPDRGLLEDLRARGVKIVAKVEGAQDFSNVDTLRWKLPYSMADRVLLQGPYDLLHVQSDRTMVVGSTRLEQLVAMARANQIEAPVRDVLVNYNFAYGTYAWAAKEWLISTEIACTQVGAQYSISKHPAVALEGRTFSPWPLGLDLETSRLLITRCSTALMQMLAIGRPVVYFNPHEERVWRDVDWPTDAVTVVKRREGLAAAVKFAKEIPAAESLALSHELLAEVFLSVDPARSAAERCAEAILDVTV
ncbi:hypothetical protein ABLE94_00790 [Gordonia sp. VNK1]|uniref:hypothetical protein n=1 Tax=Gordonia oleivorans TaxID=3156618 RepID=UPI0032B3B588